MRTLINFIIKFHFTILFVIIEFLAVLIALQYNNYQKAGAVGMVQEVKGGYNSRMFAMKGYLELRRINEELARENTRLNDVLQRAYRSNDIFFYRKNDPQHKQSYYITGATVINNRTNTQHNFLSLDKGRKDGISEGMAVTASEGIIGVIYGVSENYSTVISLLNTQLIISARLRKNGYFGSLQWDGKSYRSSRLNEIPYHVEISKGDTIETSGYSSIFPEGLQIGTVSEYEVKGGNFYDIKVNLSADFRKLRHVNVIGNLKKEERLELENSFSND